MAKKSEKGLRTVTINFGGKNRSLKFSHAAIGNFESDANAVLRSQRAIEPGNMIFADGLMQTWLGNAKIFSLAIRHGLTEDSKLDPDNAVKDIDAAIDAYIAAGGSKLDLVRDIIRAYRLATDPSSLASVERNWKISDDRQAFLTEKENNAMDTIEAMIKKAKEKTTGSPSTESPGLNSDSALPT